MAICCWSEQMSERELDAAGDASLDQALGYLNFSSGTADPLFLARINALLDGLPRKIHKLRPGKELASFSRNGWRS